MKTIDNYISNEKISSLDEYITEKLKIGKSTKQQYTCQPKDKRELRKILEERLGKNKDADLNDIDVSEITDMGLIKSRGLFEGLDPHNIDISDWNVSKVIDTSCMFYECSNFDCDLGNWDVSKVNYMGHMFRNCEKFKGEGLEYWNVSGVKNMDRMFDKCTSMKNIPSWYKS